jgi:peptidoglycan/LPS O-acetylase OafA/YrhL
LLLHTAYCPAAVLLLGPAFYLIASGCTLFGLLNLRAAHRLGDISYGIYLLQGLVLALMFSLAPLRSIAVASPLGHWATGLLGAVLLMLFALAVHVAVERPAIEIGQQLTKRPIRLVVDPVLELP